MRGKALLILLLLLAFLPTVWLRASQFGTQPYSPPLKDLNFRNLTSFATQMTNAWYTENPLHSGFILQMNPRSVETTANAFYGSYPPGFILPTYLTCLLLHRAPSVELLNAVSLAFHFLLTLIVSLLALSLLESFGPWCATLGSLLSGILILYLPPGLIFFQSVWWPDLVVLIPYALVIFLEQKPAQPKSQIAALIWAMATDWIGFLLAAVLLLKRFWSGEKKRNTKGIFVSIFFTLAFVLFVFSLHGKFADLIWKAQFRSGTLSPDFSKFLFNMGGFFYSPLLTFFAPIGCTFLASLASWAIIQTATRKKSALGDTLFLICAPMLAHAVIVNQHYGSHSYNALKLIIPLALLPVWIISKWPARKGRLEVATVVCVGLAVYLFPQAKKIWDNNVSVPPFIVDAARFVNTSSKYEHIIFSTDVLLEAVGDASRATRYREITAFALHDVHFAKSAFDISAFIHTRQTTGPLTNQPNFQLFVLGFVQNEQQHKYWKQFADGDEKISPDGNYYYLPISKKILL